MPRCPALLIGAPASGSGKTTVTAGLARLHARQGRKVRVFKVGPDFLDPLILQRASGTPVYNLDLWMVGESACAQLLAEDATHCDLILIEAVMGLYDGEPSAADLARRFNLPIVSVIDASAMAQTFGALAHGLAHYDMSLRHHGVLANRVAGPGHEEMLKSSVRAPLHWLGALSRDDGAVLPERHLGLVGANEIDDLDARLDRIADLLAATPLADLPTPVEFAFPVAAEEAPMPTLRQHRIAVASDAAFCFLYPANLDCLHRLGAELIFFSPLDDAALPACDALYLPGGYPELHAARLAANASMRASVQHWCRAGKPVFAECGGMMALFEKLIDQAGQSHAMWGILPGTVTMQTRLAAIGLQSVDLGQGALRGHTFHYSRVETPLTPVARAQRHRHGSAGEAVYRQGSVIASYLHAYFVSNPVAAAALFSAST
ncbi:MAG: cobyrinate a,c-diamide synthase [Burkholderiaceae bacterium]|nr:MAG: cobyrinate a,c-diamide synthase [Burkholderiaceae bacterium]